MRGCITRRGRRSWRIKYDTAPVAGRRQTRYLTVKGTRREAEAVLARVLHEIHTGQHADPSDITLGEWLHRWLADQKLSPLSQETYGHAVARLDKAIGKHRLQKLRPVHVHEMKLVNARTGQPLGAGATRATMRILRAALRTAVEIELVSRNVASHKRSVAAGEGAVDILGPDEIASVLGALRETPLYPIVSLALATGMRRGELMALRWSDIVKDVVHVERTLEKSVRLGYRFKAPKTRAGRRAIKIPAQTVGMLREHRRKQLELRMLLGMGKDEPDALVFCDHEGRHLIPQTVTKQWHQAVHGRWRFHALRHTHASILITEGLDIVSISRRLGHSSPAVTLSTYAHLFRDKGAAAAEIGRVLGANPVPTGRNGA